MKTLGRLLWACVALWFFAGCASLSPPRVSMGCADVLSKECDDPAAYPPLTAMLPRWPFPVLIPAAEPPPPMTPEQEAAERLLQKLGK